MTTQTEQKSLFHSNLGLFGFQAEGVARAYWAWAESGEPVRLALWDTGIGKTIYALATMALAFEDDLVDVVVVVAEANKVYDWSLVDGPRFTDLDIVKYHGTPARRANILKADPQVLVMSWETGRNDIGKFMPKGRAIAEDGMLTEHLKGKRVAIVFDEFSAMRNRTAKKYIAWDHLVRVLRKSPHKPRLMGLTATTVEKSPEDHFNACRVLSPERAPRVEDFLRWYVATYDHDGAPYSYKNLTRSQLVDPGVVPFNEVFAAITDRKRKTDEDVIDQFPAKMENAPTLVDLGEQHRALYDQIEGLFSGDDVSDEEQRQGFTLLRLLVNHPGALRFSTGVHAKQVVEAVGEQFLVQMGVAKVQALLDWQRLMGEQQTVIFTFFGQSVLPLLHNSLADAGYKVSINHGSMGLKERQQSQDQFKAGDTQIFLSSDAGAKGLNLGCGSGLMHYELPLLPGTYDQRSNRIHRIDSTHPSVTIDSLVARDTLEVPLGLNTFKRNVLAETIQEADFDDLVGDPGERYLRAHERLALLRRSL